MLRVNLGKIRMTYIDEHTELLDVDTALTEVSEQRRAQVLRMGNDRSRRLSLSAYLLLKQALINEYGIVENPIFRYSPDGKPYIEGHPEIHFNISHSKTVALLTVANEPVGADIEVIRAVSQDLVEYTMSDDEVKSITSANDFSETFFEIWTKKEALLKLTGEGLRSDMKSVLSNTDNYVIETVKTDKYVYSIAKYKIIV